MSAPAIPAPILLYDGTCGLCDAAVQWVLDRDRHGVFRFAALQGATAQALRERHPSLPVDLSTMVLVHGDRLYLRSEAAFQVASLLPAPWSWFALLRWVPRPLTDLVYRLVASVRYRLFGTVSACRLPPPSVRARFMP